MRPINWLWRAYLGESIGTFLLVFAGPGAAIVDAVSRGGVTPVGVGVSFGLAVGTAIMLVGSTSGAHINPAVTIGLAVSGRFDRAHVAPYVAAQLLGAVAASAVHRSLFGNVAHLGATIPSGSAWQALGLEFVITAFLAMTIVAVAVDRAAPPSVAAASIGAYVGLAATFSGPIAGASMNPARSFGPALLSGTWSDHWVYWLGPLVGALTGIWLWSLVRPDRVPAAAEPEAAPSG